MSWIDAVLRAAAGAGPASDLVLEPRDDGGLDARLRIEGVYRTLDACPAAGAAPALARLKALAHLPAYIVDEPQDGRIDGAAFGFAGDLRLAVLPTVRGGRAALRLPALGALPEPSQLGLADATVAALRRVLRAPQGLVVVAGPTGSGKSTTIHSLLRELASERADKVLVTIEDPVERRLPGVVQVEARPQHGLGFLDALRAALRQDVDVLVIGEVRDGETAAAAVRAALTGHLVVATLHCGRAHEAVPRLTEMGVPQHLLLPALSAVLAQRLVRLAHAPCGGAGCADCHGGFRGRRAVADLLLVDHAARTALSTGGMPTLSDDMDAAAAALIAVGATSAGEVRRVLG